MNWKRFWFWWCMLVGAGTIITTSFNASIETIRMTTAIMLLMVAHNLRK